MADERKGESALLASSLPAALRLDKLDSTSFVRLPFGGSGNLTNSPPAVYLMSLTNEASRDAQRWALTAVARIFAGPEATALSLPWTKLGYGHVVALRTVVAARYAPSTANRLLGAVRAVLEQAWLLGQYPREEFERVKAVDAVAGSRLAPGRLLEPEEIATIFQALRESPSVRAARDEALFGLLYGCALRRFEAATLLRENLKPRTLTLVGKGNKEREVPFSEAVAGAFSRWNRVRGNSLGPYLWRMSQKDKPQEGVGLLPTGVWEIVSQRSQELATARRLEPFTPHDLRRSYITLLLDAGADIAAVQKLVGHSDPATTSLYDRRHGERLRATAQRLPFPEVST